MRDFLKRKRKKNMALDILLFIFILVGIVLTHVSAGDTITMRCYTVRKTTPCKAGFVKQPGGKFCCEKKKVQSLCTK